MSTELVVGIGSRESPDHMTSPTILQWQVNLVLDDYRRKQTKKAEPNDPDFSLLRLYIDLLFKFSPDPPKSNQTRPKKNHSGGFGHRSGIALTHSPSEAPAISIALISQVILRTRACMRLSAVYPQLRN